MKLLRRVQRFYYQGQLDRINDRIRSLREEERSLAWFGPYEVEQVRAQLRTTFREKAHLEFKLQELSK